MFLRKFEACNGEKYMVYFGEKDNANCANAVGGNVIRWHISIHLYGFDAIPVIELTKRNTFYGDGSINRSFEWITKWETWYSAQDAHSLRVIWFPFLFGVPIVQPEIKTALLRKHEPCWGSHVWIVCLICTYFIIEVKYKWAYMYSSNECTVKCAEHIK